MARVNQYLSNMKENPYLSGFILMTVFAIMMFLSPELLATPPALPDMSDGDTNLLAQSAGTTQSGMYYAIWVIGIILIVVPAYYLIGAFGDWMKGRKELGEVGAVIIVGVVIVVAGMWLLSTASSLTEAGITG